ncbi:MAG: tyrosine-type recombinase/integrase [bacterium]
MKKDLKQLVRQFLEYMEIEKGRSVLTAKNYKFYLERFLGWGEINDPEKITLEKVREYRLWLNRQVSHDGAPLQKNTQNYHLIALRKFLKYLSKMDVKSMAAEKIELAKTPERQIEFLLKDELERLLEAPLKHESTKTQKHKNNETLDAPPQSPAGDCGAGVKNTKTKKHVIQLRDKAILELLFSTGLRVAELVSLKRSNISLKELDKDGVSEFTVRGKGSKLRIVFISKEAKSAVKNYLEATSLSVSPFLFIRHDKAKQNGEQTGLTSRSVQRMIEKYAKACGITKNVTPHTLRHSYATDLLINGADIRSVQSMLGHSSITTTQIYTHITDGQLKKVFSDFHDKS